MPAVASQLASKQKAPVPLAGWAPWPTAAEPAEAQCMSLAPGMTPDTLSDQAAMPGRLRAFPAFTRKTVVSNLRMVFRVSILGIGCLLVQLDARSQQDASNNVPLDLNLQVRSQTGASIRQ